MNLPILQSEVKTMSSKDLLELINQIRQNFGESPVRLMVSNGLPKCLPTRGLSNGIDEFTFC